ncbi:uncharacterized protein V1513DRAFT_453249 [Lipomyces chichibuensis]|uniref:uncharacterized protein n=1 Tax=Lipomyces chichibuensis TaxID=1546026 RepID=UPI0033435DB3
MEACKTKRMIVCASTLVAVLLQLIGLLQLCNVVRLGLPIPPIVPTLAMILPVVALFVAILPVACPLHVAEKRFFYPAIVAGNIVVAAHVLGELCRRFVRSHASEYYEARWERWFQKKSCKIGRIERALQCCGFSTPYDRAFPFADNASGSDLCVKKYHFTDACADKWAYKTDMVAKSCIFVFFMVLLASFVCLFRWIRAYKAQRSLHGVDAADEESDGDDAPANEFSKMIKTQDAAEAQTPSEDPPSYSVVEPRS